MRRTSEEELDRELEMLKLRLNRLFEEKGTFLDPNVIAVSEEIDHLILRIQRDMRHSS